MQLDISLKYPLVLVHGIAAHDRSKYFNFWGRIPKVLQDKGIKVFYGNTDSWGDFDSNAKILKNTIDKILLEQKTEKVNIIAHSKGGIDSRYYIWKNNSEEKVASLTTISTPHLGSELADLIYKQPIIHSRNIKKSLALIGKLYGDSNPDMYSTNYHLTTNKMKQFNSSILMDEKVYYQSLYTTMRNSFDDLMFSYSYLYLRIERGENDGVVSEYSVQWGENVRKIASGISHGEILDIKRRKISGIYIPGIYLKIADDLSKKGF